MQPANTSFNLNHSGTRNAQGLTLVELMVAMAISIIVGIAIFEIFIQTEYGYLHNRGTGDIVNADRHALHVVSTYLSNAGYGMAGLPGCQTTYTYSKSSTVPVPVSAITVSPGGTPATSTPPPVSLTINLSASQFAGVPVGQMVQSPSPSATNFHLNSQPGAGTTCQTNIQSGDTLIAAFGGGTCGMVVATKTPSPFQGACVINFAPGRNPSNPPGGFNSLIPNLTAAEMAAAQVYNVGNGQLSSLTFSVVPGTSAGPGQLQITTGGATATPALFAQGIDDLQVLFGYNTTGGQSVTSYGYYPTSGTISSQPNLISEIRTVTVVMVAQSGLKTPGTVTPGSPGTPNQMLLIPAIPASESITGSTLPAVYYQPPAGVNSEQFNVMRTTVPVMNLIWH
ncbi:MAG: prepilin-type N-terminal cleavage/methylation domain-containing protein [Acidithiobacillus sp.]